ncbi:glycosyltransferase family A protein [Tropicibacter sp. R15_0]|uniref:glycosyltransferase family 2 protein n=1 Tax=Tropicibacter sp. R15_0 TaxID=2821101 RepID=UPI0025709F96|nr:glycosyltransferase family A protein [Tropicibacter sp. R15_0]
MIALRKSVGSAKCLFYPISTIAFREKSAIVLKDIVIEDCQTRHTRSFNTHNLELSIRWNFAQAYGQFPIHFKATVLARTLIICPTFDHADTLIVSISSVLAQTDPDWELVVIADGSPPRTLEILEEFSARDKRIRFVSHEKGERFGEAYRDPVIRASDCEIVLHLGDDDVWGHEHIAAMHRLLKDADWGQQATLACAVDGSSSWLFSHAGTRLSRKLAQNGAVITSGLNNTGYRRDAYERLAQGWAPAPETHASDVYMWLKFLRDRELRIGVAAETTWLKLPGRRTRLKFSPEKRVMEAAPYLAQINTPDFLATLRGTASLGVPLLRTLLSHNAHQAKSYRGALRLCRWRRVRKNQQMKPVAGERFLPVKLSETQLEEFNFAFHLVRMMRGEAPPEGIRQLASPYRPLLGTYLDACARLDRAAFDGLVTVLEGPLQMPAISQLGKIRLAKMTGNSALEADLIAEATKRWPDAPWVKALG